MKQKGDRKVDTFTHANSGCTADIFLRGTRFYALLLEKDFEAPDANILRHQLADYAEHWITLVWFPIIEIEVEETRDSYRDSTEAEGVKLGRNRFYLSKSPAGEIFKVAWEVDESHRKAEMERYGYTSRYRNYGGNDDRYANKLKLLDFPLGAPLKHGDGYLIDYTPELWNKIEGIVEGIVRMRRMLKEIISSRDGITRLTSGTAPLQLQAPEVRKRTRPL